MNPGRAREKRRAKRASEFARRIPTRRSRDRVLIVCEGRKTEPNYLREIVRDLGFTSADVEICGNECDSAPMDVVEYALLRFREDPDVDKVFCVFDKDTHETYAAAVDRIHSQEMPEGKTLEAIKSVPCFEYWVLLHFEFSTKPYAASGRRSPCANLIRDLKQHFPAYEKGTRGLYQGINDKTDTAITHARAALAHAKQAGTDNPTTEMHLLVECVRRLNSE